MSLYPIHSPSGSQKPNSPTTTRTNSHTPNRSTHSNPLPGTALRFKHTQDYNGPFSTGQTAESTSLKCHIVDAPQEFDEVGAELGSEAQVWKTSVKETNEWDGEHVDGWNKTLDVILIFAALFSAISTAFVIESYKSLKEDPADVSAQALRLISQTLVQLANDTQTIELPEQTKAAEFKPPTIALVVNFLWLLSLSLSVAVSLVAMLAKEWCFTYISGRTGSPATQARRRQQRLNGLNRWKMEDLILILPSFIHAALLLFAVGLSLFLWDVHMLAALPVVVVTGVASALYVICTLLPFLDTYCPYGTTLTKIFQMLGRTIVHWFPKASTAISKSLGVRIQAATDNQQQDRVTSQALWWIITNCETPRSIDIALQSVAGASDDLPVDLLHKCDMPGLIKRRFVSLDARGPNPEHVMFLYSRAMLYLEGTLHPTYAIAHQARIKSGRLQILMWSMQLQVDGLLKSYWNAIPLGWRQELSDSCKIFTLQGTKALRLELLTGPADNGHPEQEIDPFAWTEEKVRVANWAMTVFKQDFHGDLFHLLSPVEGMSPMSKRELAHVVFSLLVTSILVHDRWTLQKIDFPMSLLRPTPKVERKGIRSDQLGLALTALALSRQAYPGWISPCPLSAASRIERAVDFLLHNETVGSPQNGEWPPVLFASDAQRLGILHILSRPELYSINEADLDILLRMLRDSDSSPPSSRINIPTLLPDFNLHRQITVDISDEIKGSEYHYFSISHNHAHTKAILEVLQHTYNRDTVGPPPTSVYLFVLKAICESPDTTPDETWGLFESFPSPTELSDIFAREIEDSGTLYLLQKAIRESSVKRQLFATSQLWLFTALLGRQDVNSDDIVHNWPRVWLKKSLTRDYGPEPTAGGRAGDAQHVQQTKANLVSRFVELLPNCPEVVPYLHHILRCMLLEEHAPDSDSRWSLFGTANMPLERLAEYFSHISLPAREPVSVPGGTEANGGT